MKLKFEYTRPQQIVFWVVLALAGLMLAAGLRPPAPHGDFDIDAFGRLAVQEGGRIKPFDTIARTSLLMIRGKQTDLVDGDKRQASEWLLELMLDPRAASQREVFRIDHPDVVGILGEHNEERKYFSIAEISKHEETLREQFALIDEEPSRRDSYQKALLKLNNALSLCGSLGTILTPPALFSRSFAEDLAVIDRIHGDMKNPDLDEKRRETVTNALQLTAAHYQRAADANTIRVIPPRADEDLYHDWRNTSESIADSVIGGTIDPVVRKYGQLAAAYAAGDAATFNRTVAEIDAMVHERAGALLGKVDAEHTFNATVPFYNSMQLYVLVLLCAALSWLVWPNVFGRLALWLLVGAVLVHTVGLGARTWIQERPPVTNLYSSAVFVGWGTVALCLILERIFRNGVAAAAGAVTGFTTLIIAHHLSLSGDTMEMMRAVLDSNFWLATHVPTVTIGYSATFLAGFLGLFYLLRERLPGGIDPQTARAIDGMVYGVVCFGLLFSFVGTVLGGIWADQSWGRFWGWDPKENGALMIVLWNAVILHARWSRVVSQAGIMQLAVFGNIITAWSWFGTNMLGVGLHSYGFMDAAFRWLVIFMASQILVICIGWLPRMQKGPAA